MRELSVASAGAIAGRRANFAAERPALIVESSSARTSSCAPRVILPFGFGAWLTRVFGLNEMAAIDMSVRPISRGCPIARSFISRVTRTRHLSGERPHSTTCDSSTIGVHTARSCFSRPFQSNPDARAIALGGPAAGAPTGAGVRHRPAQWAGTCTGGNLSGKRPSGRVFVADCQATAAAAYQGQRR